MLRLYSFSCLHCEKGAGLPKVATSECAFFCVAPFTPRLAASACFLQYSRYAPVRLSSVSLRVECAPLQIDQTLVSTAAQTLAQESNRLVAGLERCETGLLLAEWAIGNLTVEANDTRADLAVVTQKVAVLQQLVSYLLNLNSSQRLLYLEGVARAAIVNISAIQALDVVQNTRLTVLEARADDAVERIVVLEADDAIAKANITTLHGRANGVDANLSTLFSKQAATQAQLDVVAVNLTANIALATTLNGTSDNSQLRLALIENYTVPRCGPVFVCNVPVWWCSVSSLVWRSDERHGEYVCVCVSPCGPQPESDAADPVSLCAQRGVCISHRLRERRGGGGPRQCSGDRF